MRSLTCGTVRGKSARVPAGACRDRRGGVGEGVEGAGVGVVGAEGEHDHGESRLGACDGAQGRRGRARAEQRGVGAVGAQGGGECDQREVVQLVGGAAEHDARGRRGNRQMGRGGAQRHRGDVGDQMLDGDAVGQFVPSCRRSRAGRAAATPPRCRDAVAGQVAAELAADHGAVQVERSHGELVGLHLGTRFQRQTAADVAQVAEVLQDEACGFPGRARPARSCPARR